MYVRYEPIDSIRFPLNEFISRTDIVWGFFAVFLAEIRLKPEKNSQTTVYHDYEKIVIFIFNFSRDVKTGKFYFPRTSNAVTFFQCPIPEKIRFYHVVMNLFIEKFSKYTLQGLNKI